MKHRKILSWKHGDVCLALFAYPLNWRWLSAFNSIVYIRNTYEHKCNAPFFQGRHYVEAVKNADLIFWEFFMPPVPLLCSRGQNPPCVSIWCRATGWWDGGDNINWRFVTSPGTFWSISMDSQIFFPIMKSLAASIRLRRFRFNFCFCLIYVLFFLPGQMRSCLLH